MPPPALPADAQQQMPSADEPDATQTSGDEQTPLPHVLVIYMVGVCGGYKLAFYGMRV
jgi:hypothetical protein